MSERQLRWGGVGEEESNRAAASRAEEILAGMKGRREELGYKCTLPKDVIIGGTDSVKRAHAMSMEREAAEAEHARRKDEMRAEASRRMAREVAALAEKQQAEDAEARKRAADPQYAARRMAEEEAAVLHRMSEERRAILAELDAAEKQVRRDQTERPEPQQAARASLEILERQKQELEKQRRAEAVAKELEEKTLSAFTKAKDAVASREKAKSKVEDVQKRGPVKMSFKKPSLF
eukprot:TRINITY_DN20270_c0_g1_i1.p1 TRINITY_DN20270_c0_g1~~TRINITY_DN20270_c0_g1_i1.p1  ORF type:complete len:235 (-),score=68.69 TRINITY_DN20270_c0_g1_i1:210-914(-)